MGDMNLTFDDGSVVRLHLTPVVKDTAESARPTPAKQTGAKAPLELPPDFGVAQPVSVPARAAEALTRGGEALVEALHPLGGVLDGIHQSFAGSVQRPDEVTVEFGVTLGSDLSLGIFSGKGEASFTVSASWNFTSATDTAPITQPSLPANETTAPIVS
ncbi:CU044_2847 family protein [Streptomyces sp. NPDC007901]|uniref:CU044_2847 family protein n=1 Tax=Streptomyces sp. NPDC007901 TaxID=3364785 RepID=UPI0036E2CDF1